MKRTIMTYMVAAIVSFAAIGAQVVSRMNAVAQEEEQPPQGTVACGQVVQGNVTLTANLNCSGDGLIVADDGTTINLNGFGIHGPGADSSKVGIGVSENNIIIRGPGIISGFQVGLLATRAGQLSINSVILQHNQIAAFLTEAPAVSIQQNIMKNNNIAVASHPGSG